jgi:RNA polymerase sigma factor (sigma-70 family)
VIRKTVHGFVTALEEAHGRELRRYLLARMRHAAADVPDLVQEIFLRLLRIRDHEAIRNPQAYLYTVASHVLHQHALRRAAMPENMDPLEVVQALQSNVAADPADEVEIEQRIRTLAAGLEQLSPRAYAALVMYRCEDMTLEQIGERLGVSHSMVRKYLARAISYCEQHLDAGE